MGESFQAELEQVAKRHGIDLFGVADLTVAQAFVCDQGGEYLKKFPKAVSIGIHLPDEVVDELYKHRDREVISRYKNLYDSVNSRLDHAASMLASRIQESGYQAYPVPASQTVDPKRLVGVISHKLAANLAGLGWIGKSCLLVTVDYGPRVRFSTILTDAPLKTGFPLNERCKDCGACLNTCPVKAFTGISFNTSETRESRFHAHLCESYMRKRQEELGESLCGLCVYVCPHGRFKSQNVRLGISRNAAQSCLSRGGVN